VFGLRYGWEEGVEVIAEGYEEDAETGEEFEVQDGGEADAAVVAEGFSGYSGETGDWFAHSLEDVGIGIGSGV